MATKSSKKVVEWVCGVIRPQSGSEPSDDGLPGILIWLQQDGEIVGQTLCGPDGAASVVGESLRETLADLPKGEKAPSRVRVASTELAAALRQSHPNLEVECAPTPEVGAFEADIEDELAELADLPRYIQGNVTPHQVGAAFKAMESFYQTALWQHVPSEFANLELSIPDLNLPLAVVLVMGETNPQRGFVLLETPEAFRSHVLATAQNRHASVAPSLPAYKVAQLGPKASCPPTLAVEIEHHGWQILDGIYPAVLATRDDNTFESLSAGDWEAMEAVAHTLVEVAKEGESVARAGDGDEPFSKTVTVSTHARKVQVTFRAFDLMAVASRIHSGAVPPLGPNATTAAPEWSSGRDSTGQSTPYPNRPHNAFTSGGRDRRGKKGREARQKKH
ncbi:MAG: hypothetical protein IPK82_42650 [Polyangiaceae bacterium]|nr:hypothetical protein [Polyangiaceae bacterium]